MVNDISDLMLGKIDPNAGESLGRFFMKAREWGASIRELTDAIRENPIARFFAEMSGYGLKLMLWGAGFAFLAGTVRKLASAIFLLSGASTLLGALKTVGSIAALVGGGTATAGGVAATAATGAAAGGAATGLLGGWSAMLKGFARLGIWGAAGAGAWELGKQSYTGDTFYKQGKAWLPGPDDALHAIGSYLKSFVTSENGPASAGVYTQTAMDSARTAHAAGFGGSTTETLPGKTADDLGLITTRIDASSIGEIVRPSGTQDVSVVNQQPPNVTVHAPISITGIADPQAVANAAISQLGSAVKNAADTQFSD
ncbi:hypothetical protein [Rhizobium miluonense]|uniref:Phage tail sheath protein FI n=1 Tax=Rhizobium miluonense TaxID=411945 RepID=A0ABU1SMM6_9HYPH|nr:hypothetical protein [Rhizobium miluonense]MDR6900213.1 phage tail sheath protein FI [Rhizobium miluonense]